MTDIIKGWEKLSKYQYKYTNEYGDVCYLFKKIVNNKYLSRKDGPAIEYWNGTKHWYTDGNRNRIDGPASEYAGGDKYWFLRNIQYSKTKYFLVIL